MDSDSFFFEFEEDRNTVSSYEIKIDVSGLSEENKDKFLDCLNNIYEMREGRKLFIKMNEFLSSYDHLTTIKQKKISDIQVKDQTEFEEKLGKYFEDLNCTLDINKSFEYIFKSNENDDDFKLTIKQLGKQSIIEKSWSSNILVVTSFLKEESSVDNKTGFSADGKNKGQHSLKLSEDILIFNSLSRTETVNLKCEESETKYKCGSAKFPNWLIVAHELIHYMHWLEDPLMYFTTTRSMAGVALDHGRFDDKKEGQTFFWRWSESAEELRTVIGLYSEDVSELSFREEWDLQPRYAYQGKEHHFMEDISYLDSMLKFRKKYHDKSNLKDFVDFEFSIH